MPSFSYLYSIPYITLFLLLYVNIIPLYRTKIVSFYNYSIFLQQFFIVALLVIFFGFRGFVHTDWIVYYSVYDNSPTLFDGSYHIKKFLGRSMESGFLFYMIICKTISSNYFFLQLISFVIDFLILFYFFKRIIPKYIAFGFIFFMLFSGIDLEFNLLRNSKAIMLFLISIKYIEEKKFVKYVVINSLGALFHITSLLYFPLYFILNKKISRKIMLIIFIIGNVIFLLQIEWCRSLLTFISTRIPGRIGYLMEIYLESDLYSKSYGITIGYLERFFTFIFIYCFFEKLCRINKSNLIYINTFFIYCFIFLYFSEIAILLQRVTLLFIFPYWILYPQIYSLIKKKQVFLIILLFYGILKMSVGNNNIIKSYDNVLLQYKTYGERVNIRDKHGEYIIK